MEKIILHIADMIKEKKTSPKEVSKNLNISNGNLSNLINGKRKATKPLIRLAEIIYGDLRTPHPEQIIEKAILMMEDMEKDTQESAFNCIQKEKWLEELKKEKSERKTA
jgi:transcriptional regulator with XRE-family HTH domain